MKHGVLVKKLEALCKVALEARTTVLDDELSMSEPRQAPLESKVWLSTIPSPFANDVAPDLPSTFVGRHEELARIDAAFRAGQRHFVIVGDAGSGKSSIARLFAARAKSAFPAGVVTASAARFESSASSLERVLLGGAGDPALVIIDDAELFDDAMLIRLEAVLARAPQLRVILTSRRHIRLARAQTIFLSSGLNQADFEELLKRGAAQVYKAYSKDVITRLFQISGGSPAFASLASAAVQAGAVESWEDLLAHLRDFHTPGVVGRNGRPLVEESEEYSRIVAHVS
jgi:AAA ATPase domain